MSSMIFYFFSKNIPFSIRNVEIMTTVARIWRPIETIGWGREGICEEVLCLSNNSETSKRPEFSKNGKLNRRNWL